MKHKTIGCLTRHEHHAMVPELVQFIQRGIKTF